MISEAKRAQIIAALKLNPNGAAVAKEIGGVSRGTVGAIARRAGIDLGARGWKKFPPQKRAEIAAALRLNPNASAVAKQFGGISKETVRNIAREAQIELAEENRAKTNRLSTRKRAQIIKALKALPNATEVARRIGGVSARTVGVIAKKANIPLGGANRQAAR
jgi:transposase-like protein